MNFTGRKAIIYFRVSTEEQADKGYSMADQRDRLLKFCEMFSMTVVAIFEDDCSAKSFDRPGWSKMLEFVKHHKKAANILLFTNWSRFSRAENMGETYMMIDRLKKLGVEPQAMEQPIDFSIPESDLLLSLYVASPAVENKRRSSNIVNGMRRAMKSGRWCRKAPLGYQNARDEKGKPVIIPDPAVSPAIKYIFEKHMEGRPPVEIIKGARKIYPIHGGKSVIREIISNPVYAGFIKIPVFKDEAEQVIVGLHTGIVSPDIYYAAQKRFTHRAGYHKATNDGLPLRGLLHCDECGGALTGSPSTGRHGGKFLYYRCLRCKGMNLSAAKVHSELAAILSTISMNQQQVDGLISQVDKEFKILMAGQVALRAKLEKEVSKLEKDLKSLEDKFITNQIDVVMYQKYYPDFRSRISSALLKLEAMQVKKDEVAGLYRTALPRLMNMNLLYEKCGASGKKELLGYIFNGLFRSKKGIYRTPFLNPIFSVKSATEAGLRIGGKTHKTRNEPMVDLDGSITNPERLLRLVLGIAA